MTTAETDQTDCDEPPSALNVCSSDRTFTQAAEVTDFDPNEEIKKKGDDDEEEDLDRKLDDVNMAKMRAPAEDPIEEERKREALSGKLLVMEKEWWTVHKFSMHVMRQLKSNLYDVFQLEANGKDNILALEDVLKKVGRWISIIKIKTSMTKQTGSRINIYFKRADQFRDTLVANKAKIKEERAEKER